MAALATSAPLGETGETQSPSLVKGEKKSLGYPLPVFTPNNWGGFHRNPSVDYCIPLAFLL